MLRETLKELGLSSKEISIYLTILPLGSAPSSTLAKRTSMPRSTAKFTCEQLSKKGLLRENKKGNAVIYYAEPPQTIFYILEQRKQKIKKIESDFNKIISDLETLYNPNAVLPKIKFYTNRQEVMGILEEMLLQIPDKGEICSLVNILSIEESTPEDLKIINRFYKKRLAKKITTRVLTPPSTDAEALQKKDKQYLRETRIATLDKLNLSGGEIFFLEDKIYNISLKGTDSFGLVVENKGLASMYKSLFEFAWKNAA